MEWQVGKLGRQVRRHCIRVDVRVYDATEHGMTEQRHKNQKSG